MKTKILNAIENHEKIILLRHIIPDGDAYGVQLGLKNIIQENWPEKIVKASGQDAGYLDFIGTMDDVSDEDFKDSLVIVGDCGNVARIDDQRFKLAKTVIKIDHHPNNEPYGDIIWVDEEFGSASEMIAELVYEGNLKLTKNAAKIIYHGMVTDSGRFLFKRTNSRTFKLAAFLLETGFDLDELYRDMYQKDEAELKFTSYVYENYASTGNGVLYLILTKEELVKLNIDSNTAASKVNLLANIKNKPIWIFFCEDQYGVIRIEIRSNKYIINEVATKYGGGGHSLAAGIRLNNFNNIQNIIEDYNQLIK